MESRWSPLKYLCQVGGVSGIPRVPHGPSGFHVEMDNNLAGLPAKQFHLDSRWNSYFHVDSMWNHLESMGEGKVLLFCSD